MPLLQYFATQLKYTKKINCPFRKAIGLIEIISESTFETVHLSLSPTFSALDVFMDSLESAKLK